MEVEIDFRKSPQDNANHYFEESKWAKKKLEASKKALEKTMKEIEELGKEEIVIEEKVKKKEVKEKWYQKFHWTVYKEFIIVGGKNATQNELLFKKHLEVNDIALHADIPGAPLTIIKSNGNISEEIIREASVIAASYSSAWKGGVSAVDVYWIKPDQVSKTAPAGEYLTKGSFMIRGTKNYLRRVELKLAIGIKDSEVISGSVGNIKSQTDDFVIIKPGNIEQKELAKQIKERLKTDINIDEIRRKIPTGDGIII